MIVEGVAVVIPGDDVDTDVMYPGAYLNIEDPGGDEAVPVRRLRPLAPRPARPRAIVVTGRNFGLGSSREHVVQALKAWGVPAVVGKSFARIFRRNCVNLGLRDLRGPGGRRQRRSPAQRIRIDTDAGEIVVDGHDFTAPSRAPRSSRSCRRPAGSFPGRRSEP